MQVRHCRLFALLLLAPLVSGGGVHPVTLGIVVPPDEYDAASLLHGAQLAVAEANESGDVPVTLEVRGEHGQWGTAGNDAVILACNRHVDAMIAPSDGAASHLILQVAGRTRVPVATVCSDSSVTEAGVPWAVRVVARTDQQAAALFAAARESIVPSQHWWAVVPSGRPGRAIRRDLEQAGHANAVALDRIVDIGASNTGPDSVVQMVVAANPDGVLLWIPPAEAGTVVASLRTAGYRGFLGGPGPINAPEFVAAAGAAADGVLVSAFQEDADFRARANAFESRFRDCYHTEPDSSAAAAHDAALVLIKTLSHAGDGAGYRQFPLSLSTEGITGMLRFDNSGNRTGMLRVMTWQRGRLTPVPPSRLKS